MIGKSTVSDSLPAIPQYSVKVNGELVPTRIPDAAGAREFVRAKTQVLSGESKL